MTKNQYEDLDQEGKLLFDSIHLIMRMSRHAYEKALEEGFTPTQSLEMSKAYMGNVMLMGAKK